MSTDDITAMTSPARRERERLAAILEDTRTDPDTVPSFMRAAYAQWLRDVPDDPGAGQQSLIPEVTQLLIEHSRLLPDIDEGEPLTDDTEWTCTACSDTIGVGQDFETYAADHQARVLAAAGALMSVRNRAGCADDDPKGVVRVSDSTSEASDG